jgi:hypothetical protein
MGRTKKWAGRSGVVLIALLPTSTLAGCAQSWSDTAGRTLTEQQGPDHCGWQSATFVYYEGNRYVHDPEGVFSMSDGGIEMTYEEDVALPDDATFTGFKKGDAELWEAPGLEAVFVKTDEGVEQWPLTESGCG